MRSILNQAIGASFFIRASHPLLIAGAGTLAMLFMATAFGTTQNTVLFDGRYEEIIEKVATPAPDELAAAIPLHAREVLIQRGDNLASVLDRMGINDAEAFVFLRNNKKAEALARQLAPGKVFSAQVKQNGELHSLIFPLNGERSNALVIERTIEGFAAETHAMPVETKVSLKSATIQHSLFGAADGAGIPDGIAVQLADVFSGDIDFHRDLRKGDKFSVIYETTTHQGKTVGSPRILAAEFINDGKSFRAFWYQPENGTGGYYTETGRSVRKAFLRSPLEFSRITSGFSNARYHPVLRETRAHRGIDYGAPTGARVKTTGDGVIEFAGVQGGYGKVIMVRHAGNRTTVYSHLSGFASGIRKGTRVAQGEVIGYVGATGIATGPHLHYEFRVDGIHRNPVAVVLPDAPPLPSVQLAAYKASVQELTSQIETIRDVRIALLD